MSHFRTELHPRALALLAALICFTDYAPGHAADVPDPKADFHQRIQPLLVKYCYECHGDGSNKGGLALDDYKSDDALLQNQEAWLKVLKNMRSNLMPPAKAKQPTPDEKLALANWIKFGAFGIDPQHPDPGRVTLRRLNRAEYTNTIRDLMAVEFKADEEFPPDDTGYGFDNIGDALNVSPLLLEKYMQAAEGIVARAVPTTSRAIAETIIPGAAFRSAADKEKDKADPKAAKSRKKDGGQESRSLPFTEAATLAATHTVAAAGTYRIGVDFKVNGSFQYDPGKCSVRFMLGETELLKTEYVWQDGKKYHYDYEQKWEPGEVTFTLQLEPLGAKEKREGRIDLRIVSVQIVGPTEPEKLNRPKNFERYFTKDAPADPVERRAYATDVLTRFATKAFRRPADERTIKRLVTIAETAYNAPNKNFEQGIAQAMVAVLASPRFLFRTEEIVKGATHAPLTPNPSPARGEGNYALVDEYAFASRLSYFFWSTMPDDELIMLASKNELRKNLPAQIQRLMADPRSEAFVTNFVGQWLQARDVEGVSVDARVIQARDAGTDKELAEIFKKLQEFRAKREEETKQLIAEGKPVPEKQRLPEEEKLRARSKELTRGPAIEFDGALRTAMRRETEMFFDSIVRENRNVLDLLDSDYTFLNERLAKHYGIPGVSGDQMRRVTLPANSPRGGVLTQGTVLVVTSNPTRTSPVKRGLFLLDNILGAPSRPAPPEVPALEASEDAFKDKEPSLREVLQVHRAKPLCSSCHNQMDPLGLALENFNAMGLWRDSERKVPIDAAATLSTGESFADVRALKKVLKTAHREEFYRCLTEKILTFALGRGLEYYDVEAVDRIVERLEKSGGKCSELIAGIVESVPFQMRRVK